MYWWSVPHFSRETDYFELSEEQRKVDTFRCDNCTKPMKVDASTQTRIKFEDISWCGDIDLMNKKEMKRNMTAADITSSSSKFYTGGFSIHVCQCFKAETLHSLHSSLDINDWTIPLLVWHSSVQGCSRGRDLQDWDRDMGGQDGGQIY